MVALEVDGLEPRQRRVQQEVDDRAGLQAPVDVIAEIHHHRAATDEGLGVLEYLPVQLL